MNATRCAFYSFLDNCNKWLICNFRFSKYNKQSTWHWQRPFCLHSTYFFTSVKFTEVKSCMQDFYQKFNISTLLYYCLRCILLPPQVNYFYVYLFVYFGRCAGGWYFQNGREKTLWGHWWANITKSRQNFPNQMMFVKKYDNRELLRPWLKRSNMKKEKKGKERKPYFRFIK